MTFVSDSLPSAVCLQCPVKKLDDGVIQTVSRGTQYFPNKFPSGNHPQWSHPVQHIAQEFPV